MRFADLFDKVVWRLPYPLRYSVQSARKRFAPGTYQRWLTTRYPKLVAPLPENHSPQPPVYPFFSLITLVFNPRPKHFELCANSVLAQDCPNFEWVMVVNGPQNAKVSSLVTRFTQNKRVRTIHFPVPVGITKGTVHAAMRARGIWLAFLDHDDLLDPTAMSTFAQVARAKPEYSFLYCDHDHCDDGGRRFEPVLKPAPSPEYLLGVNYVTHFHAIKKTSFLSLSKDHNPSLDGSQDWDISMKGLNTQSCYHIPRILYSHRRHPAQFSAKLYLQKRNKARKTIETSQRVCLESYLKTKQQRDNYCVVALGAKGLFQLKYENKNPPPITVLVSNVPTSKTAEILKAIEAHTNYPNYQLRLIQEQSPSDFWESGFKGIETQYFAYLPANLELISPNWLLDSVGTLERSSKTALVGGKILSPSNLPVSSVIALQNSRPFVRLRHYPATVEPAGIELRREVSGLWNLWWIGKTQAFAKIPIENRTTFDGYFDAHCCLELKKLGYQSIYDPNLRARLTTPVTRISTLTEAHDFYSLHQERLNQDPYFPEIAYAWREFEKAGNSGELSKRY